MWLVASVLAWPAASACAAANAESASEALATIDARLAQTPKDPKLQFRRGVALSAAGRTSEAIAAFKRLIDDHPELAAAYNNLAALEADEGNDEVARALLQKAVQLRPGYATALHNLGDVQLRLAVAAYGEAFKADPSDTVARGRMASLQMWPDSHPAPTQITVPALVQVATATTVVGSPAASSAPKTQGAVAPGHAVDDTSIADVTAVVRNWADDWSRRDAGAYIGYYAPDFKGRSASHAEWVAERKLKLGRPTRISVELSDFVVSVIGSDATVRFRQKYTSDATTSVDQKVLRLVRNPGGRWLITGETVER